MNLEMIFRMEKINYINKFSEAYKKIVEIDKPLKDKLDPVIKWLIKIRVSQINGCAYCPNMHTKEALSLGETNRRIFLLNAWSETSIKTKKEKVVLELAEKLTLVAINFISKYLYDRIKV